MRLEQVSISPQTIDRFLPLFGEAAVQTAHALGERLRERMDGRVLWNVNATSTGGGVAEMLRSVLTYTRGLGIDARWVVIAGRPRFFAVTKRLHHALHGSPGDGSPLGKRERKVYDDTLRKNAEDLLGVVKPRDIVLLHDPQTAGLAPYLVRAGAIVIWRCHIGADELEEQAELGWDFLAPYLDGIAATVFSRRQYVPSCCDHERAHVIPPSIDAFSAKNQAMSEATVRAILVHTGLLEGPPGEGRPEYVREDGSPSRVDRQADVVRLGRAPSADDPIVLQVSRWDSLKDPIGVMRGFAALIDVGHNAQLVLAGPTVLSIADDPEQAAVLNEVEDAWRALPRAIRNHVHLACLPMADVEENGAIVNALQRHAAIVVQKSLREGFGLTVTEAMWKSRPVVASRVGGIGDQIEDGVSGLLLKDPRDPQEFSAALARLLNDRSYAERLGEAAQRRVAENYLGLRHLTQWAQLIEAVDSRLPAGTMF
jgi:trehalose synthase